jgi:UDP-GlcNAc:undecaprenyl-phosphate/decaprenyl-phosphate GlcNAc-1-phosphate transferase
MDVDQRTIVAICVAFAGTLALLHYFVPLARRIGLVDRPNSVKVHDEPIPLVGGLAIFVAFAISMASLEVGLTPYRPLLVAGALLVIVGMLDDFHELSSTARFGAQIVAALVMCFWGDVRLQDMGVLRATGEITQLGLWEVPLTVFCVVGVVNAINMADGLDGLSSGLVGIALAAMLFESSMAGRIADASVLAVLLSAVFAFWLMNTRAPGRERANAFLGDAGSLFLGFVLAWFVVDLSQGDARTLSPVQALWFVAIPLLDTVRLLLWRAAAGRSPSRGDQEHLHHLLRRVGLNHGMSVAIILALAVLGVAVGIGGPRLGVSEVILFNAFMVVFTTYSLLLGYTWWRKRFLVWPLLQRVNVADRRQESDRRDETERRQGGRRTSTERRN